MIKWDLRKFDPELCFIWTLIDKRFRDFRGFQTTEFSSGQLDWRKIMAYARISRGVLYKFGQEVIKMELASIDFQTIQSLQLEIEKGNQNLMRLCRTLKTIKNLWDGQVDYYLIKTRDDRPTGDADVLFLTKNDYEAAISIALQHDYKFVREEPFKGWVEVKDGVKIELHHGLSWFGMKVLDSDFVGSKTRNVELMNLAFRTISGKAELALELAHWILDIQPLGPMGFSNLVSVIETNDSWTDVLHQAETYGWADQLSYHLSILNMLCTYVYHSQLDLPVTLCNPRIEPSFPFWNPFYIKIPFFANKVLHDNEGFFQKLNMLQLALRRYVWTRISE